MRFRGAGLILLAAAVLLAACDAAVTPAPASPSTGAPGPGATSTASQPPSASAVRSAAPTKPPTTPTARPPSPSTLASGGPAAACTGSDNNRTFFANSAAAVAWDLYCAVLPAGWYVDVGSFRAASGGIVTVSYKTSAGLRLELAEGAICSGTAADCAPLDSSLGSATFGDRTGSLGTHSGNLVLYVAPGSNPAWQATGVGLDEASFRGLCAALAKVAG